MTGLLMVIMLVLVALVVDIGHTRLVQRQLQAGVDAAALAGALDLPIKDKAEATAQNYSPTPGKKNAVNTIDNATTTAEALCITTIPGCDTRLRPVNAIRVTSTAKVPTFFARIIGINSLTVSAKATACNPCSARPVDIMIVLDRTGSMCNDSSGGSCSSGTDLDAAKDGVRSFLLALDPKLDRVGLAVLPPAVGPSVYSYKDGPPCLKWKSGKPKTDANCTEWTQVRVDNPDSPGDKVDDVPTQDPFYFGYKAYAPWWEARTDPNYKNQDRAFYVVSSLSDDDVDNDPSDDYLAKTTKTECDRRGRNCTTTETWGLNDNAPIVNTLKNIKAAGSTSYSLAIDEAARELKSRGRPGIPKAIVFFTDGGANTYPNPQATNWHTSGDPLRKQPCGSGVAAARRAENEVPNLAIYTIGYDLDNDDDNGQKCLVPLLPSGEQNLGRNPTLEPRQDWSQPGSRYALPKDALRAMASTPDNFYYTADPTALQVLFGKIAGDVLTNAARLVNNDDPTFKLDQ